ncbi:carbohydrate ABC transporter permease [Deinococcus roseus]|nr:carbohydrate ABC transporter permease [Deinococcus roseus]
MTIQRTDQVVKTTVRPTVVIQSVLFTVLLLVIAAYLLLPFVWGVITSFKPASAIFEGPAKMMAAPWTLDNYAQVFAYPGFYKGLLNSTIVSLGAVLLSLVVGVFAAYALGKYKFYGKTVIMYVILAVSMFPQIAVLSGLYTMIQQAKLYDNPLGLIFSYLIFTIPFSVWVLTSFVREIPNELEEAAMMDGATPLQTLIQVILPVMGPALVTTGLLAFINAWNEYLFALTFMSQNRTIPVVIANYSGSSQYETPWANIMAASILVTVPLIVLVLIFQKNIVSGLTSGAVKG